MKVIRLLCIFIVVFLLLTKTSIAQNDACTLTQPVISANSPNIFNDRQEQDLGDALAEITEHELTLLPASASTEVGRIGQKILAQLPPSGLKYSFRIYDSGELNAFSIAGGHIYISRKLVVAVDSEDELAGVIAHEIGHIASHQTAIEFTRVLKLRLGVTEVSDRADIFAKVHKFYETPAKKNEAESGEIKDELLADQIALYALTRAGYAPKTFPSFFNKVTVNKGKTSNWLTEFLGVSNENSKRYGVAMKSVQALPDSCKVKEPSKGTDFAAWQKRLIEERLHEAETENIKDAKLNLDPKVRPSLSQLRFSQDGRYILAQDEASISVINRAQARVQLRVDAPDSYNASFAPDNNQLVFYDPKLHIEKWDIAAGKRLFVKEMVVYDGCQQTYLSVDGNILVCGKLIIKDDSPRVGLQLIDVNTDKHIYDKQNFYQPLSYNYFENFRLFFALYSGEPFVNIQESPNGHYLFITAGTQTLAYDELQHSLISVSGRLKEIFQSVATFVGDDKIFVVGQHSSKNYNRSASLLLSFPEGKLIKEVEAGSMQLESTSNSDSVLMSDLKEYAVAAYDTKAEKFTVASRLPAMDVWDKFSVTENVTGGIAIRPIEADSKELLVDIPMGNLPHPRSASISRDGKYLAFSMRNRAEFWNLETGRGIALNRPFYSSWFDDKDQFWGDYQKFRDMPPASLKISFDPYATVVLTQGTVEKKDDSKDTKKKDKEKDKDKDDEAQNPTKVNGIQYHDMALSWKPLGRGRETNHHAQLTVKKMATQELAWTRDFEHETPAIWAAEDNRMVLGWDLTNDAVKDEVKLYPKLNEQFEALKKAKKGLLLETVDPQTGKAYQQVMVPVADLSHGWDDERWARISGDYVLAHGEHDTTIIFRISDGSKVGEFFGYVIASDSALGIVAASNREGEVILVDERTGNELKRFQLGSEILVSRIVTSGSKTLIVMTADQVIHKIPLQ